MCSEISDVTLADFQIVGLWFLEWISESCVFVVDGPSNIPVHKILDSNILLIVKIDSNLT